MSGESDLMRDALAPKTSAEIRVIPSAPEDVGVVELLEHALERAREGEFSSVAIAIVDRDGCTSSGWSKLHTPATMLGAVLRLQQDLLDV